MNNKIVINLILIIIVTMKNFINLKLYEHKNNATKMTIKNILNS